MTSPSFIFRTEGYRPDPPRPDPAAAADAIGFRVVAQLRNWHRLWLRCSGCHHASLIDARWLRARRPAGEKLADLAQRLRCTGCGRLGGAWWSVIDTPPGWTKGC